MNNADMPAMPTPVMENGSASHGAEPTYGLTKRELFAMHMISPWLSHGLTPKDAARSAIECADALLAELDKTGETK